MDTDDYSKKISVISFEIIDGINESTLQEQHPSQMPMRQVSPVEYLFTNRENKQSLNVNTEGECAINYLTSVPEYKFTRDYLINEANIHYNNGVPTTNNNDIEQVQESLNSYNNVEILNINNSTDKTPELSKYLEHIKQLKKDLRNLDKDNTTTSEEDYKSKIKPQRDYILNVINDIKTYIYNVDNDIYAEVPSIIYEIDKQEIQFNNLDILSNKTTPVNSPTYSSPSSPTHADNPLDVVVEPIIKNNKSSVINANEVVFIKNGYWNVKQGLTPEFIHQLCIKHDVSHYVFDITQQLVLKHVSNNRNKPALMYYAINNHMYLVKESDRKSLVEKAKEIHTNVNTVMLENEEVANKFRGLPIYENKSFIRLSINV